MICGAGRSSLGGRPFWRRRSGAALRRHLTEQGLSPAPSAALLVGVLFLVFTIGCHAVGPASAAELLVFEQRGCPFCAKFEDEIAPRYDESEAGRLAPLRRVDIHQDRRGGIDGLSPAVFTPTFVLVDHGKEVGRLEGYPGKKYFYPEIEALTAKLPNAKPATIKTPASGSTAPVQLERTPAAG